MSGFVTAYLRLHPLAFATVTVAFWTAVTVFFLAYLGVLP